jgi:HD-GYP domain-containing protein (c-di-GMP phosphodiesterase class II)
LYSVQASTAPSVGADDPVTLITASRRYQIAAADLRLGMFVAELDRPWLDTPFLLQGFVADSQVEIDTLRKYCSYVYVDLAASSPEVADAIRRAEIRQEAVASTDAPPEFMDVSKASRPDAEPVQPAARPAASGRVYKTRADIQISTDTRQRFRQFVRATAAPRPQAERDSVFGRALGWLIEKLGGAGSRRRKGESRTRASVDTTKSWLPADMELKPYAELRGVEQELPRARTVFQNSEDVLKTLVTDVKAGRIPQIGPVSGAVEEMIESMVANPDALMWVARLRDEDINTYNHGVKVALYLLSLGRHLGFPKNQLSHLGMIGMLADVGKIKLPRALLDKPGMLAPSEFGMIKEHVRLGLEAIAASDSTLPAAVESGIAQHHERLDGTGYPNGLKGGEINIYGRMTAIADSFAALITPRPYANPSAPQDALMNLYEWAGSSFHEPLVEAFVQAVGVFPVGSLVELSTGEVAVVVAHNRVRRLEPRVLVLTWPDKSALSIPAERDLLASQGNGGPGRVRILRGLPSGAYGLKMRDYYLGEIARQNDASA